MLREGRPCATMSQLLDKLEAALAKKASANSPVNRARQAVLQDCLEAAEQEPGLFSLTVPTGGGKTLSSLAFALKHAALHGMDRVIISIPFTSIVEQTATVLKAILGEENVLEHHSGFDGSDLDTEESYSQRLATQNWDAPVIVTTNVQLFESLFSNRPGKSRKVHRIARSVIILDEAQTLPDSLLQPSLALLEELALGYGTSIVLCTATQPALDMVWPFGSHPAEITKRTELFPEAFGSRVAYDMLGTIEQDELVSLLGDHDQALCVVDTKDGARTIYRDLVRQAVRNGVLADEAQAFGQGFFHLSTSMTPVHRMEVLDRVRQRLKDGKRCMVVSTQLVEAGVDVDFPVVYRELAGIDSLVQAAGRCNREGRRERGLVRVFEYAIDGDRQKTGPWLEKMKDIGRSVIKENGGTVDESLVRPFFEGRYQTEDLDAKGIFSALSHESIVRNAFATIPFEQVANDYRIIDEGQVPIFIPRGDAARDEFKRMMAAENPAAHIMKLQRYSVSVSHWLAQEYEKLGALCAAGPLLALREERLSDFYDEAVGLVKPKEVEFKPLFF